MSNMNQAPVAQTGAAHLRRSPVVDPWAGRGMKIAALSAVAALALTACAKKVDGTATVAAAVAPGATTTISAPPQERPNVSGSLAPVNTDLCKTEAGRAALIAEDLGLQGYEKDADCDSFLPGSSHPDTPSTIALARTLFMNQDAGDPINTEPIRGVTIQVVNDELPNGKSAFETLPADSDYVGLNTAYSPAVQDVSYPRLMTRLNNGTDKPVDFVLTLAPRDGVAGFPNDSQAFNILKQLSDDTIHSVFPQATLPD